MRDEKALSDRIEEVASRLDPDAPPQSGRPPFGPASGVEPVLDPEWDEAQEAEFDPGVSEMPADRAGADKAMIAASKANKRKLMVAQHMRFEARAEKLKEVVTGGALGQIYTAETKWLRRRGIPGWGKFHIKKESLGGPLIDIGVHMMDLCVWLMGSPKPIAASGKVYRMFGDRPDLCNGEWGVPYPAKEFTVEDYATAFIRFENDITLQMSVSWAANVHDEIENMYILGDKGGIGINPLGLFSADHSSLNHSTWDWLSDEDGHRREVRHFCECVEKDLPVLVKPEESLRIQKIIDAIYESSAKNKEIVIK